MKKLLLTIILIGAYTFIAIAQTPITWGVKGGVNFTNQHTGNTNGTTSGTLTTFAAGFFADAPIGTQGFSIRPSLFYTGKGGKSTDNVSTSKVKLYYLQLPVNVVYSVPVSKTGKLFFGGGLYLAYGMWGVYEYQSPLRTISSDITFGSNSNADYKRTDTGLNFLLGFKLNKGFMIDVNSDMGFSNTRPGYYDDGIRIKNRAFGISAGYNF